MKIEEELEAIFRKELIDAFKFESVERLRKQFSDFSEDGLWQRALTSSYELYEKHKDPIRYVIDAEILYCIYRKAAPL